MSLCCLLAPSSQSIKMYNCASFTEAYCSGGLVGVEHHSDGGSHGLAGEVLGESNSDGSLVSVSVDNLSPADSNSSVIDSVLGLEHIGDSPAQVKSGSLNILAILDGNKGFIWSLESFTSSESSEYSFLV